MASDEKGESRERAPSVRAGTAADAFAAAPDPVETSELQTHIGSKLKALYAEVVNQPVPDRLLELVRKLESREGGG